MTAAENLSVAAIGPTLDFQQVSLVLGRTSILDNVSFQVRPGSVHALVGPNGGGKSSLIKTLLGQMPHQGTLSLAWQGEVGTIGYVPQALEFDRGLPMTVDDFMAAMCQRRPAFLGLSKHYAKAIDEALAIVDKRREAPAVERRRAPIQQNRQVERAAKAGDENDRWIRHEATSCKEVSWRSVYHIRRRRRRTAMGAVDHS